MTMDFQAKQTHRRMMKVPLLKKPRVILEERSDASAAAAVLQLRDYGSTAATTTVTEILSASSTSVPVVSPLPTSTAALAGVGAFIGLIIVMVGVGCFYRRRKLRVRLNKNKAPSAAFNQSAMFVEKKDPFAAATFEHHLEVNLSPSIKVHHPATPSTASSSSEESGWRSPPSALRVKNHTESYTGMPALPKAVAEKNRASQRTTGKPSRISIHAEEFVGSPPPSYDMANGAPGFVFPIPSQMPPEKSRAIATPPTPPARQKSFRTTKKEKVANLQALVVPTHVEPAPVVSPARSESFAPKQLTIPPPPPALSAASSSNNSSSQGFNHAEARGPRLMTVIAQYTPSLADELQITVGDTVRLMQQYKDGWGFVQHVGKGDAPRGVVPMICLQERKQVVPTMSHKASNSSVGSLNAGWR